jgi:hypothetical protein
MNKIMMISTDVKLIPEEPDAAYLEAGLPENTRVAGEIPGGLACARD